MQHFDNFFPIQLNVTEKTYTQTNSKIDTNLKRAKNCSVLLHSFIVKLFEKSEQFTCDLGL